MCLCVIRAKIMCHTKCDIDWYLVYWHCGLYSSCIAILLAIWNMCLSLMLGTYVLVKLFAEMQYTLKAKVCFGSGIYGFLKKLYASLNAFKHSSS